MNDNYKYLLKEHNIIPMIPINPRGSKDVFLNKQNKANDAPINSELAEALAKLNLK